MNQQLLLEQTEVETRALEHATKALEAVLDWTVDGDGFARKLSSVRFATDLYQRHLERLFALEEIDGYMEALARLKPELASEVERLRQEHEQLREDIRRIAVRIDLATAADAEHFSETCERLKKAVSDVLMHERREGDLLTQAFYCEVGGEG